MIWSVVKVGLQRCFLRLESSMQIYLGFFGINNGMEFMFSIFWAFKFFDVCDTCINTYKFSLIAIVTSCLYYVCMF
jgi:hypothetical protein